MEDNSWLNEREEFLSELRGLNGFTEHQLLIKLVDTIRLIDFRSRNGMFRYQMEAYEMGDAGLSITLREWLMHGRPFPISELKWSVLISNIKESRRDFGESMDHDVPMHDFEIILQRPIEIGGFYTRPFTGEQQYPRFGSTTKVGIPCHYYDHSEISDSLKNIVDELIYRHRKKDESTRSPRPW